MDSLGVFHRVEGTQLILDPDASEKAVGVVLSQIVDGIEQPIAFHSEVLKELLYAEFKRIHKS